MRKFIVLCVVLILTLISPIYAFADDPEEFDSSGDRLATEEELQELDAAISETSHNLAILMASGDPVKATDYEQATYNLLSSVFGSSTSSWASIVATRLGYLSTINTSANGIAVKLTQFYNSINPDYDTTGISMYDIGHGLLTALTSIDPNDGDLTIIETLVYITSALDDLDTDLTAILNSTYSIDNKLVTINTAIVQFKSDLLNSISTLNTNMNTGFTNVNANLASIISRLQSFENNFSSIDWGTRYSYLGFYNGLDNFRNNVPITSSQAVNDLYIKFHYPDTMYGNNLIRFVIPYTYQNYQPNPYTIEYFVYINNNLISIPITTYSFDSSYCYYIFTDSLPSFLSENTDIVLHLHINNGWLAYSQFTSYFNIVSSNSFDYYTIYNFLVNRQVNYNILKLTNLYASDDLIAAKEDQQAYEDQAIQDFTGSGSAAASGQDLGDMKSISGAIKSGLQTGGSVNNALAPFNTNSGFWGWFSQNNYDNINNIPSSGTRSGNNSQPDIIDFYTNNQYTLQGLLSGGGN